MRLLVVNPNTTVAMTDAIAAEARRRARPGTEVEAVTAPWGTPSVESHAEEALAAVATLEAVAARAGTVDGVVVACFGDPGLEAVREVSPVPAVGIAEAAMAVAVTLGHRFSIVAARDRARPLMVDVVRRHGFESRCASVRTTGLSVLELEQSPKVAEEAIVAAAQRAVEEDGAEAICLGCAGMAGLDERVSARLGVPAVDGVGAAVKLLEAVVDLGLQTSRVAAYQPPEPKPLTGPAALVSALGG
jgi:allantoin racemase